MKGSYTVGTAFMALVTICLVSSEEEVQFRFPEYDYLASTKHENAFKEYEMACEQSPRCENDDGINKINCIRECVSPSCYKEIYQFDELEEGEVDVRLNSFKGCFSQRIGRTRN